MGLMLGKIDKDCIIIQSSWALPVEGTETRVNAHSQAYEYMSKYMDDIKAVDRLEPVVGWYHSHPGYGCWVEDYKFKTLLPRNILNKFLLLLTLSRNMLFTYLALFLFFFQKSVYKDVFVFLAYCSHSI